MSRSKGKIADHWSDSVEYLVLLCVTQPTKCRPKAEHTHTGRAAVHIRTLVLSLVTVFTGSRLLQEECRLFTTDYTLFKHTDKSVALTCRS